MRIARFTQDYDGRFKTFHQDWTRRELLRFRDLNYIFHNGKMSESEYLEFEDLKSKK